MKRTRALLSCVLLAGSLATTGITAGPAAAACAWHTVTVPQPGTGSRQLNDVVALSGTNIWAVGYRAAAGATLVLHYNGNRWKVVPSPNPSTFTALEDLTAIGPRNLWAVGWFVKGSGKVRTLIEHWNGKRWKIVDSPNPLANNYLFGVDGVNGSNIWAVGTNGQPGNKTLIEHYNGNNWSVVQGASLASGGELLDVSAISGSNAVAVGDAPSTGQSDALVERWNGSSWTRESVPVAENSGVGARLRSVSTPSNSEQLAVGDLVGNAALKTLAEENTGSGWQELATANKGNAGQINILHDVDINATGPGFAVGYYENKNFKQRTLVERHSGGTWSIMNSPNSGTGHNELFGVAVVRPTNVWAVGSASTPISQKSLVLHYHC